MRLAVAFLLLALLAVCYAKNKSGGAFILQNSQKNGKPDPSHWYFVLKASNNEVILTSEIYNSKDAALNGIASVRIHSTDAANFQSKTSTKSKSQPYYFVLRANNRKVIGTSEMYTTTAARDNGIESVMDFAQLAEIQGN